MNSKTTCRIVGWVFLMQGVAGIAMGHLGAYLQFTQIESYVSLALGILAVLGARRRRRVAALTLAVAGLCCLLWGTAGMWMQHPLFGSLEPLDSIIRELAAIWSLGTCAHDVLAWRRHISAT
ncbi:hypothetical protein NZD89_07840 [Alicyclobacillus fastidiosus]|uniref:Uncharacterized protein n=2 Tax=Alicyclobacillus fastidiosus TaxID=392011 RepID=A0ABY6ZMV2_9BACL|nr:hypothetical protein [Alicyclobacillus fastidiosus]WAH43295.1 hypothetical protein NZD89_07840 [Alicyclobacillus fastidiosus]